MPAFGPRDGPGRCRLAAMSVRQAWIWVCAKFLRPGTCVACAADPHGVCEEHYDARQW